MYHVLAQILNLIAGIERIIIPGDFKSGEDDKSQAISCSVKANDGFLYPLKVSLIFIQKPIIYIKHKEIKYVQFSRIGQKGSSGSGRCFDISITKIDQDGAPQEFKNIDKRELKVMMQYFKDAKIKMRQIDPDSGKGVELESLNSDELDEEIR